MINSLHAGEAQGGSVVECLTGNLRVESHQMHSVMFLGRPPYPLLSMGSLKEDPSRHN